jgi:hypothetical protein
MNFAARQSRSPFLVRARRKLVIGLALLAAALGGCSAAYQLGMPASGSMVIESLHDEPLVVSGRYRTAVFTDSSGVETSMFLSDTPVDAIASGAARQAQVLHLELLWVPKAGSTPMSSSATNVSVRYYVFSGGEVGVYGGAGFAMPHGELGGDAITITLRDASLKLIGSSAGFHDLLTPARLSGSFTAVRDHAAARRAQHLLATSAPLARR